MAYGAIRVKFGLVERFLESDHIKDACHEGSTHPHRSFDMIRTSETLY
jgi:hypothetical protein